MDVQGQIYTIGHSTHPIDIFIAMLKSFEIAALADVRTVPQSRYNPQFGQEVLSRALSEVGIAYHYMKALGGLRKARTDSRNTGWRNGGFRGYADHMQTKEFQDALNGLIALGMGERTAIMCAESLPWQCHRSLIADALITRGIRVENIMGIGKTKAAKLTDFAMLEGAQITYPPKAPQLNFG